MKCIAKTITFMTLFFIMALSLLVLTVNAHRQEAAIDVAISKVESSTVLKTEGGFAPNYTQILYDCNNTLPIDDVTAICHTKDGFIWIGSYEGLVRYDGKNFDIITSFQGTNVTNISARVLFEDSIGRLWIGTNDDGVLCYNKGTFKQFTVASYSDSIRAITEDKNGNIVVGTFKNTYVISLIDEIICKDALKEIAPQSFAVLPDGRIIAATATGTLVGINADFSLFEVPYNQTAKISTVFTDDKKNVYLGTETGDIMTLRGQKLECPFTQKINSFYRTAANELWVCSISGVGYFDNGNIFHLMNDSLLNGNVLGMAQDHEQSLWFAGDRNGLLQAMRGSFCPFLGAGLSDLCVNAITKYDNKWYIGADTGLFVFTDSRMPRTNKLTTLLQKTRVRALYTDSKNRIWVATYSKNTVVCFDAKTDTLTVYNDGLGCEKARNFLELSNGTMAVGTANGLAFITNGKISTDNVITKAIGPVMVLSLAKKNGTLYVGTDGDGIYALRGGKVTNISKKDGLCGNVVMRFALDTQNGGIFVGCGNGLSFIRDDFTVIKPPFMSKGIFDMLMVEEGKLWITSSAGITIIDTNKAANGEESVITTISKKDGLSSPLSSNSWNYIENDILYLACTKGVNTISTSLKRDFSSTPLIAIGDIKTDDGTPHNPYDPEIAITNNATRLDIDLSYISFLPISDGKVVYQLVNYDKAPIEKSAIDIRRNNVISYSNIAGGQYTFKVNAVDANGTLGNALELNIIKEYGFFEMPIVKIFIVAASILFIVAITLIIVTVRNYYAEKKQLAYRSVTIQAITAIVNALDKKDAYTSGHSERVAEVAVLIAKKLHCSVSFVENIYYIGLLHDIGKIGIPADIINKPGKLTEDEFSEIKKHTAYGYDILKNISVIPNLATGAKEHHEKFNGSGYNDHKEGYDISLEGRIICAADSFDAMSSDRIYRKGLPNDVIRAEFERCKGIQFDPQIADIVIQLIDKGELEKIKTREFSADNISEATALAENPQ